MLREKMKPYQPSSKVAVRDNLDEDFSDDVEDDVFIRDGKLSKSYEENGLKRPLMAPRRKKHKVSSPVAAIIKKKVKCWKYCEPFCYGFVALAVLIAIIFLAAILLTLFPVPLQKVKLWLRKDGILQIPNDPSDYRMFVGELVPCTQINVHKTWSKAFSKLSSESSVRKCDVNKDGIEDIIIGYGIDDNFQYDGTSIPKCEDGTGGLCEGGILTIDGLNGNTIWQTWTAFNVFSLYCSEDLNGDSFDDCVASGRGGLVVGVNGRSGNILWQLKDDTEDTRASIINLYTVNAIRDLDADNIPDVLAVHVEERKNSRAAHIKLISGKSGKVIRSIPTPYKEEVFVPIQIITQPDGTECLLIVTGGQSSPGGVYLIRIHSLMQYTTESDFTTVIQLPDSGFMVPAIITDITGDNIEDIIVASFNSTIYAFDGKSLEIIWTYSFPTSETVSDLVPGHFNNDNTTDFLVKYNAGPGFPVYYYSQTTVLNGIDGTTLIDQMIKDSGGPYSLLGGVTISQSFGGDFFLHWQSHCRGQSGAIDPYQFVPDSDIIQQARADTCMLRYNTSTVLKLYAIARHIEPPALEVKDLKASIRYFKFVTKFLKKGFNAKSVWMYRTGLQIACAVIFSTDDLVLQLNQTELAQIQKQISVFPLKHPKMLKKTLNKETTDQPNGKVFVNQDSISGRPLTADTSMDEIIKRTKSVKNPANNLIFSDQNEFERGNYEAGKLNRGFVYPNSDVVDKPMDIEQENELGALEEYENYLNSDPSRKISIRTKYPQNRDVRSKSEITGEDLMDYDTISTDTDLEENSTHTEESKTKKKILEENNSGILDEQNQPETLWDLELEKETAEAIKDAKGFDFATRSIRQVKWKQNLLSSISSTGVLVKSIDAAVPNSIDFVFVLNVRESEAYPPLFLPEDLACVQDKLSGYRSFSNDDLLSLEKKFLKQCLLNRIQNMTPMQPKFESQTVVTRISISCNCGNLQAGEICSKLNDIDNQKWTGFMGNNRNGLF